MLLTFRCMIMVAIGYSTSAVSVGILYLFVPTSLEEASVRRAVAGRRRQTVTGYFVVVDRESYRRRSMPSRLRDAVADSTIGGCGTSSGGGTVAN